MDANGDPIPGAEVRIGMGEVSSLPPSTLTDQDGVVQDYYLTYGPMPMYAELISVPDGYLMPTKSYYTFTENETELVITCHTRVTYTVMLVDADGEPISDVGLRIQPVAVSAMQPTMYTGEDGCVRIDSTTAIPFNLFIVYVESVPVEYANSIDGWYHPEKGSTELVVQIQPDE